MGKILGQKDQPVKQHFFWSCAEESISLEEEDLSEIINGHLIVIDYFLPGLNGGCIESIWKINNDILNC